MHIRERLEDLAPLIFGPHHECIHRPFNVGLVVVPSSGLPEDPRLGRSSTSCWPTIIGLGFICRAIDCLGLWKSQSRNKKRERGKALIKWRARFKLSFICYQRLYFHHKEHFSKWALGKQTLPEGQSFLLSGKFDLKGLRATNWIHCQLTQSGVLPLFPSSIWIQRIKPFDF